jgi:hypothetical protein
MPNETNVNPTQALPHPPTLLIALAALRPPPHSPGPFSKTRRAPSQELRKDCFGNCRNMTACKLHLSFFIPLSQCHRSSTVEGALLWTTNCLSSSYLAYPWKSSMGCQPTLPAGPCHSPACLRHVRQNRTAPHSATCALSRVSPWPVASFSFHVRRGWHSGVHSSSWRPTLTCLDSSKTRLRSICVIFVNA